MRQITKSVMSRILGRILGLVFWTLFIFFSQNAYDTFFNACIQVLLVTLTFLFIIPIPEFFNKVNPKQAQSKQKMQKGGKK